MQRPFVSINMAASVDGKITSARREYPRLTSRHDRNRMDRLRAESDCVVVGAGTLRADDPNLHVRNPALMDYRRSLGKPDGLLKVVVTASLDLDPQGRFASNPDGGGLVVATVDSAPADRVAVWNERAEVWRLGAERVDLPRLLDRLADRGIQRLLLEGGGRLNWDFIAADLVDEINVTVAPTLLGGENAPTLLEGSGFSMDQQKRLRLIDLTRAGDELFCRWSVVKGS